MFVYNMVATIDNRMTLNDYIYTMNDFVFFDNECGSFAAYTHNCITYYLNESFDTRLSSHSTHSIVFDTVFFSACQKCCLRFLFSSII